jgi:hypothetical protein
MRGFGESQPDAQLHAPAYPEFPAGERGYDADRAGAPSLNAISTTNCN